MTSIYKDILVLEISFVLAHSFSPLPSPCPFTSSHIPNENNNKTCFLNMSNKEDRNVIYVKILHNYNVWKRNIITCKYRVHSIRIQTLFFFLKVAQKCLKSTHNKCNMKKYSKNVHNILSYWCSQILSSPALGWFHAIVIAKPRAKLSGCRCRKIFQAQRDRTLLDISDTSWPLEAELNCFFSCIIKSSLIDNQYLLEQLSVCFHLW